MMMIMKHPNYGRRKLYCIVNYDQYADLCKAQKEIFDAGEEGNCLDKIMTDIEHTIEVTLESEFGLEYDVYFYLADEKELEEVF